MFHITIIDSKMIRVGTYLFYTVQSPFCIFRPLRESHSASSGLLGPPRELHFAYSGLLAPPRARGLVRRPWLLVGGVRKAKGKWRPRAGPARTGTRSTRPTQGQPAERKLWEQSRATPPKMAKQEKTSMGKHCQ